MTTITTVKKAQEFGKIGRIASNTKIPGTTHSIDAFACITGSKLAKLEGTPCFSCYARKLQKLRPSVDKGWKANLEKYNAASSIDWVAAMVFQIDRYTDGYHRWFVSGDLQSVQMLQDIVDVCLMTPSVKHWLPTQERGFVKAYKKEGGTIPDNLIVRVSSGTVNVEMTGADHTSNLFTKGHLPLGKECKAQSRANNCGDCRACWDKDVPSISYPKH